MRVEALSEAQDYTNRNFRIPDLGVTCAKALADVMVAEPVLLIVLDAFYETSSLRA